LLIAASVITVVVVALAAVSWPSKPTWAAERSGDAALLARLAGLQGYHRMSVAVVDAGPGGAKVRRADIGADGSTPYEAGSVTKALTGLVIADGVRRGELKLDQRASDFLDLGGTAAGEVSLRELVTQSSGYPRLGAKTQRRGQLTAFTGGNPYTADDADLLVEVREVEPSGRGSYAYSNLGAAVAGQAAARAAGLSYPDLMRTRLFEPLGMSRTLVSDREVVEPGLSERGLEMDPWVMHAYSPAGGVVTTRDDLVLLAEAVLAGRAPGMAALTPLAGTDRASARIGMFWQTSTKGDLQVVWHNGRTGGYSSFVGFDRKRQRAVVLLSDVSKSVDDVALDLLTAKS
jgi:CubicO group peptidase (beta-lactamase class C family)